jgi:hypothetical protein
MHGTTLCTQNSSKAQNLSFFCGKLSTNKTNLSLILGAKLKTFNLF